MDLFSIPSRAECNIVLVDLGLLTDVSGSMVEC